MINGIRLKEIQVKKVFRNKIKSLYLNPLKTKKNHKKHTIPII